MIDRFTRIHREFGWGASARLVLMIVGLIGMSLLGVFGFDSWWPTVIAIIGLVLGFLLKRQIVEAFEWTTWALPIAGIIYGVLLFIGERLGLSREVQLMLITFTTVVVLDLQFWSLSDPAIVKVEDKR
jgi:hypothetical protein